MTPSQLTALRELRAAGYAVIIWTPEELGDVEAKHVEDMSISYASEYLIPEEEETETGEDLAQFFGPSAR